MKKFNFGMSLFLVVSLTTLLLSCGAKSSNTTIVYATPSGNEPETIDPAYGEAPALVSNICEGLVGYEGMENTQLVPRLAERWNVSNDGLNYTFYLRKGIKFHDGTDMNADAVLFSLNRQQDPKHPYYDKVHYGYWNGVGLSNVIESITKQDDYTVVMKLKLRDSTLPSKLGMSIANIISPTAFKKLGVEAFGKAPVCTGPFTFKKWEMSQMVLLEKNEQYWDKDAIPKVKNIIFKFMASAPARLLALEKGEVDIAEDVPLQDLNKIKDNKDLKILKSPIYYQIYLHLNVDYAPLSNTKVRLALAHLMDKQKISGAASFGEYSPVVNPIPKNMWGYNSDIEDYPYDVEKAKQLMKEAGYENGFEMSILYRQGDDVRKSVAEILQDEFSKVGVKVTIQVLEGGALSKITGNREEKGGVVGSWGADYLDPDNFLVPSFSSASAVKPGLNFTGWTNAEFDKYNSDALNTNDKSQRLALYKKSQEVFHQEMPSIPIFDRPKFIGMKKNVKNFQFIPIMYPIFKYVEKN